MDKCIDAVGVEAHAKATPDPIYDKAKQVLMLETGRPDVLREMIAVTALDALCAKSLEGAERYRTLLRDCSGFPRKLGAMRDIAA